MRVGIRGVAAVLCALLTFAVSELACAAEWGPVDTHVTVIDPGNVGILSSSTQVYGAFYVQIDQNVGQSCTTPINYSTCCVAGAWLFWSPPFYGESLHADEISRQMANAKAILSTTQLALALGTKVRITVYDKRSDGYCQISHINSLNQ